MKRVTYLIRFFILASVFASVIVLSACGDMIVPSGELASKTVIAEIDLICKGIKDPSVEIIDADECIETRAELINELAEKIFEDMGVNEEQMEGVRGSLSDLLSQVKYSVSNVEKIDRGEFYITVMFEPIRPFYGIDEVFNSKYDYRSIVKLDSDEIKAEKCKTVIESLRRNADNPVYADPREIKLHYGKISSEGNTIYRIDENDAEKIGENLFYADNYELKLPVPDSEYAKDFVKAILEYTLKGDTGKIEELTGPDEDGLFDDDHIDNMVGALEEMLQQLEGVDDEQISFVKELYKAGIESIEYSVGDPQIVSDGEYDFPVSVESIHVDYEDGITNESIMEYFDVTALSSYEDSEIQREYSRALVRFIKDNAKNPNYRKAEEYTIHFGKQEDGDYSIDTDVFRDIFEKIWEF